MKTLLIFSAVLFISVLIFSQPFGQEWAARYNGPGNTTDQAYAIVTDIAGNVYVTGYSNGSGTGKDMFTMKYNSSGVQMWTSRYNGPVNGGDYSFAIALDLSGNVYVTGRSDRGVSSLSDFTTIKYNNNGVQQWVALYDGIGHGGDEAIALVVDAGSNVYVSGKSYGTASYDILTVKYNSAGAEQWAAVFNGAANNEDWATSMALDQAGNVYVCGGSVGAGLDYVLLKINPSGTIDWFKTYNGPVSGGDGASSVKINTSGFVYVTGFSYGGAVTSYDFVTIKYDPSGNEVWLRNFNGEGSRTDIANAMTLDLNGNIYITGTSLGINNNADSNFATIKYSPDGTHLWTSYYSSRLGMASDVSRAIVTDQNANVYVTGNSGLIGLTDDYTTIKYNSSGVQQWVLTYNGPDNNNDWTSSMALDNSGYVYVTGKSFSSVNDFDYVTIKYSNLVGIHQTGTNIPAEYGLFQNYPNPFNPVTGFKFQIPGEEAVRIIVYDVLGNEVKTIVNEILKPGTYKADFDGTNFASGIYFYKMTAGNFTAAKKMILSK